MYTAEDYGTGLIPPRNWPHKTWLALIHTGDNHGPPTANEVAALLERARRDLPGVRIRLGRLSDFSDAIKKEKPDLPIVRADRAPARLPVVSAARAPSASSVQSPAVPPAVSDDIANPLALAPATCIASIPTDFAL
jgi:hypothetical protein